MAEGARTQNRQGEDSRKHKATQEQLEDLFAIDLDEIRGVVADGGDAGAASGHEIRGVRQMEMMKVRLPAYRRTLLQGLPYHTDGRRYPATTTMEQHKRNKRTIGTHYGVPEDVFSEILDHDYIRLNLPTPPGLEWTQTAWKTMKLVVRRG